MRNAGLDEAQAGIKISGRNINYWRYTDDTTLTAESKEELKSLLIKVKEESEKVVLKFNIQKTKIMASGPITKGSSWLRDSSCVFYVFFTGRRILYHCATWESLGILNYFLNIPDIPIQLFLKYVSLVSSCLLKLRAA